MRACSGDGGICCCNENRILLPITAAESHRKKEKSTNSRHQRQVLISICFGPEHCLCLLLGAPSQQIEDTHYSVFRQPLVATPLNITKQKNLSKWRFSFVFDFTVYQILTRKHPIGYKIAWNCISLSVLLMNWLDVSISPQYNPACKKKKILDIIMFHSS